MTPREIAEAIINFDYLDDIEVTYKVPELAKAYLALANEQKKLEARIQDLELQLDLTEAEADRE